MDVLVKSGYGTQEEARASISQYLARFLEQVPNGALKIYLGSTNVGYTTERSVVAILVSDRELLTIYRTNTGIFIDATILGADDSVIATVEKNKPYINEKHKQLWRSDRPDRSTLEIRNMDGRKALMVKYVNPSALVVLGIFRNHGKVITIEESNISLDNGTVIVGSMLRGEVLLAR